MANKQTQRISENQITMRLLSIFVENFLPLNGKHALDLTSINAATVSGSNEAGKSSLLIDAPLFALFGKARKRPEGLIYDLADEATVKVSMSHHGESYTIQRGIKRGKNQTLKLWHGKKDISERLLTNTQKKLDDILGFSYDLLLSTAIAQQDEINMLSVMGATDREKILNEMIGNEHWEVKRKKVGDILNEHKDLNKNIAEKETELAVISQDLDEHTKKISFIEEQQLIPNRTLLTLLDYQLTELEANREDWDKHLKIANDLNLLCSEVKGLSEQVDNVPVDDDILAQIGVLETSKKENNQLMADAGEYRNSLIAKRNNLGKEINKIRDLISLEPATTILQSVPCVGLDIHDRCKLLSNALESKGKIDSYLKDYIDEDLPTLLKITLDKQSAVDRDIKEVDDAKDITTKENTGYSVRINDLNNKFNIIRKSDEIVLRYTDKKKELDILRVKAVESEAGKEFDSVRYTEVRDKSHKLRNEIQTYELELAKLQAEQKMLLQNQQVVSDKLDTLKTVEESLAGYRTLHTAYNEIPTLLFEEAIPTIEEYTNEILHKIAPEKTIQLRSFKENKNNSVSKALDVVSSQSTGIRDFDDLSGSAKFRQSLALRIALARYNRERHNTEIDFFVIDEGFSSLDGENTYLMKTALKEIATHFDLFLMITHLEDLKDTFPTQIVVNSDGKTERIKVIDA
jgi:DNA repair protein SbcC/Rad50